MRDVDGVWARLCISVSGPNLSLDCYCPITPALAEFNSLHVFDLIDPTTEDWDVEKVQGLFWLVDNNVMLGTPHSRIGEPDLQLALFQQ
ncbi:UNVERIFIED_CONTAM: hypothetical protein Slati_1516200 [Sesamum latifolium]|uniref:Uncharacterized protein n=1 Tax=Sesamum latifolium TaxID=2727402 RepID=A0AAW2X6Y1_9LAMI